MFVKSRSFFYNCKFKTKMLVSYLLISLIPVICIGAVSYVTAARLLNEQTVKWVRDYSEKTGTILEKSTSLINNQLDKTVFDDDFLLCAKGVEHGQVSREEIALLCDQVKQDFVNDNIGIISVELIFRIDVLNTEADQHLRNMVTELEKNGYKDSECIWYPDDRYIYIIREVYDFYNNISIGKLIAVVGLNDFFKNSISNDNSENAAIITFDDNRIAYVDSGSAINTGIPSFNVLRNAEDNKFSYNGIEYLTAKYPIDGTQFTVYGISPYDEVRQKINNIVIISTVTTVICVVVVISLSLYMSFGLTRRIDQIIDQMKNVAKGEFMVDFSDISGDEIGKLQTVFANLVDQIDKLIKVNYQSRITQNELKLKALQAQINPHFLYNCLDNLNWHAIMSGDDRANHVITQLSNFYRTSLNSGKDITTVKNEISNVMSYMDLQLDLNENSFDFSIEQQEGTEEYVIVNLVLQPLLENAINYGILKITDRNMRGKIALSVQKTDGNLVFKVRNNGPSIKPQIADSVLRTKTKGYGLSNVHERIKLFFGEGYGITIYPVADGTECCLTVPALREYMGGDYVNE